MWILFLGTYFEEQSNNIGSYWYITVPILNTFLYIYILDNLCLDTDEG